MRIVLVDIRGNEGYVTKDTVVGGYGARLVPFSRVTAVYSYVKRAFLTLPSVQMAYLAAIAARHGHEVVYTRKKQVDGDVTLVLSSLVDYRGETAWADAARQRGIRVGFVGLAASKMPHLFADHADFLIQGEPESAMFQLASGKRLEGIVESPALPDLDMLPFPRWDLLHDGGGLRYGLSKRFSGNGFPVMASRGCPEFCTYCPHRILASYRARTVKNIVDEIELLCDQNPMPYVIFRDPLFTEKRDRCLELGDEIRARGLNIRFEFETRLDGLDEELLDKLHGVGLQAINFGVESVSPETLRKVGRRPVAEAQQRAIIEGCSRRGIETVAFYVFGFLPDDWNSISATIDYSIALGSTVAQFKLLTPYPGTPLWKRMEPLVFEKDWQKFDGFTPTFRHPNLTSQELRFLLGAAYARFYIRPSYLANYLRIRNERLGKLIRVLDQKALQKHAKLEKAAMSRTVTC
jgi:anaerobic magnesium-protoporphyrin IX monomethyl ester cyclase